jgi:hypothetical protein
VAPGTTNIPSEGLAEPFALQIAGDVARAAATWRAIGCPYEGGCALAEIDDLVMMRRAVAIFEELGARPAIGHAICRLRTLGVRDLSALRRGPRATIRANRAGPIRRKAEALGPVAAGLRNAEIAERL